MAETDQNFEKPLVDLRRRIEELEGYPEGSGHAAEIDRLRSKLAKQSKEVFAKLDPWQKTLVARHLERPYTLDYVAFLLTDWIELRGDRAFADDPAIVAGFGRLGERSIALIGHQKGRGTAGRIHRNFGQPRPEGYRKALRIMKLAERFGVPVVTLIDTPGAYPGIGAEERGQAEAIARNLIEMADLEVPIVAVVTGEGGSGGALALGVANTVLILEYSIYSVISPEGCAAILWKDQDRKAEAAKALRLTAPELLELGVVDGIIPEPAGGAHTQPGVVCRSVGAAITRALDELEGLDATALVSARAARFRALGAHRER